MAKSNGPKQADLERIIGATSALNMLAGRIIGRLTKCQPADRRGLSVALKMVREQAELANRELDTLFGEPAGTANGCLDLDALDATDLADRLAAQPPAK